MTKSLSLIGISGSRVGQSIVFSARSTILGTDPECGVVFQDRLILPRHAEFRAALGRWFVVSLDPRAAIFVNGQPVTGQQRVEHGSLITLGATTFRAVIGELERAVGETHVHTPTESQGREDWWRD